MHFARGADSDVTITCDKKKFEDTAGAASGENTGVNKKSENWGYTVSVENEGFKALTGLEVKYIIFYKHSELGIKGPPQKKTKTGSYTIDTLAAIGKTSFDTDPVTLTKASLGGGAIFGNGARSRVADTLSGLWIRIYKDGNLFAEYAYPAGLTSTETWQE